MFLFRVKIPIFVLDNPVLALCVTKENNSVTHNNPTNLTQFVKTQLEGVDKSMKEKFAFIFSGSIFLLIKNISTFKNKLSLHVNRVTQFDKIGALISCHPLSL